MSSVFTRAIMPAAIFALCLSAFAADKLVAQMQGLYDQEAKALRAKDMKTFGKYYSTDYVETRSGKKSTRKEFLDGVGQMLTQAKSFTSTIKVLAATPKDGAVVAKYRFTYDMAQADPQGKVHHVTGVEEGTETWRKSGSSYVCTKTLITKDEAKLDGKPIKSPGM